MTFLSFGVSVLVAAAGAVWSGFVLTLLWGWFVVPTFGLPTLHVVPAIGLTITVAHLTPPSTFKLEGDPLSDLYLLALRPAVGLAMGWAVHQFM